MKIMTFNTQHCLNYVTNKIDFEVMAKVITELDPDVVGLNEMRGLGSSPEYTEQVERLAQLTGMKYFYFAPALRMACGPYGNGILSKFPIKKLERVMIPAPAAQIYRKDYYETRCILKAEIEGVTFLITHIGLNPDEKINAVRLIIENLASEKCVLMGDFNMIPTDPILAPVFDRMTDTAKCLDSDKKSFPSDAPRIKIDYILISGDGRTVSADIPSIIASDHLPYIAEVEF